MTKDFTIAVQNSLRIVDATTTNASDNTKSDGSASVNVTGGVQPYSFRWCDGSVTGVGLNKQLRAGTCVVTVTDAQGCSDTKSLLISSNECASIRKNSQFYTTTDTFDIKCAGECSGSATIISLSPEYKLPVRSYQWQSSENTPTAFKLCQGTNSVTITDADGKTCVSRFTLKAPSPLAATITVDDKALTAEIIATGGVQPYRYQWTTQNLDTSRKVTNLVNGKLFVLISDKFGCATTREAEIQVGTNCLEGSIILTPNDDGRNETFQFKKCDLKNVRFEVYNRWGQLVYSKDDYQGDWKGNDRDGDAGKQLPEGVYLYVLKAVDQTGATILTKGTVSLVRQ